LENSDDTPHTATANDGSFDTGVIDGGSSGSAAVGESDTIAYHCDIHPFMTGTLQVVTAVANNMSSSNSTTTTTTITPSNSSLASPSVDAQSNNSSLQTFEQAKLVLKQAIIALQEALLTLQQASLALDQTEISSASNSTNLNNNNMTTTAASNPAG
jgi:hypothetical protein